MRADLSTRDWCTLVPGTKWWCVHTFSTRLLCINTPFRPVRRHLKHEHSSDCPEGPKTVCTHRPGAHFKRIFQRLNQLQSQSHFNLSTRSLAKAKTQSAWERVCTMRWQAATFRQTFWFLFLLYVCLFGRLVFRYESRFFCKFLPEKLFPKFELSWHSTKAGHKKINVNFKRPPCSARSIWNSSLLVSPTRTA